MKKSLFVLLLGTTVVYAADNPETLAERAHKNAHAKSSMPPSLRSAARRRWEGSKR